MPTLKLPTLKLPTLRRRVHFSEMPPRGYGIGYWEPWSPVGYAYLVPLNLLVRCWFKCWQWLLYWEPSKFDKALHEAYRRGRLDEFNERKEQNGTENPPNFT